LRDSEWAIFKIDIEKHSRFAIIYKKVLIDQEFDPHQPDCGNSIFLTDKLEAKLLLEFLTEEPKKSLLAYLKTHKLLNL